MKDLRARWCVDSPQKLAAAEISACEIAENSLAKGNVTKYIPHEAFKVNCARHVDF